MGPRISIVVPVYNVEPYLDRCIQSILNQTYTNLEILLIDDGSTDRSGEICDRYGKLDARIRVIHKDNGGLSDARNAGLDAMTGAYVICIDSDDFVSKFHVENLYRTLVHTGSQIACSQIVKFYDKDPMPEERAFCTDYVDVRKKEAFFEKMLYQDMVDVNATCKIFKSDLFRNVRFQKGKLYEDVITTYRVIDQVDRIGLYSRKEYYYYQRENSIAQAKFDLRKMDCIAHGKELEAFIALHYPKLTKAAQCRYFSAVCNILFLIPQGEYEDERDFLWTEIKKYRRTILFDTKGRKKARLGAAVSCLGYHGMRWIYKRVNP